MSSSLFNRLYLDYTFNILNAASALAAKSANSGDSSDLILESFLEENLDADLKKKRYLDIQELIEERTGDFAKNNTEQLLESIETNAKLLAHALHRYNILKAPYNDDLDTQIRGKVSGNSVKNIARQRVNEEKEYLASVVDLCSELLKNSKSERKKVKEVLKELFGLDSRNLFIMSLVLLPIHIPMVLFTAWLEVNMSDYDPNAPYNFSPWLDSLSWPAWLALMYGFSLVLSFFWRQMSKTEATPTNKWSKISGVECGFCIEPLLDLLSESRIQTSYKYANKDGSPDKRRNDNPSTGESVAEFRCESCENKSSAKLFYTDQELTKFGIIDSSS